MTYQDTIDYLFGLQKFGMKFGLDNIRRLLALLGNPQDSFRSVHVAGTNGKGSTSAMIESILRTSGKRTGLFTSPHLISFTERIRVCGEEIPESEVVELAGMIRSAIAGAPDFSPTFFEVVTALGFCWFRQSGVEWAVIETGLGGRLDATNVIMPAVSVITPVDIDHREFLGTTLAEIASEKAGIIKQGVRVVLAPQAQEVQRVIEDKAADARAPLSIFRRDYFIADSPEGLLEYRGTRDFSCLRLSLAGEHQKLNAAVALRAIEQILDAEPGLAVDVRKGLAQVDWPGRLELVSGSPRIMIDGAHNPAAARTLAAHLTAHAGDWHRIILVAGVMADKDVDGVLAPLLPLASETVLCAPAYGRAASPEALLERASAAGFRSCRTAASVAEALRIAKELAGPDDLVLITGSFYTIGEAMEALGRRGVLARLRE